MVSQRVDQERELSGRLGGASAVKAHAEGGGVSTAMTDPRTDGLDAAGPETAGTRRSIVSRRSLPNGRALVGALLVTIAAVGAFVFSNRAESGPADEYLVLLRDIGAGGSVSATDIGSEPMTLSPELADIAFTPTRGETAAHLDGATALRFLHAGALLLAPDLRGAERIAGADTTEIHELTLPVPVDRAPEVLTRGDRVTVLGYDSRNDATWTVVEDGLVLDYRTSRDSLGPSSHGLLTLALSDPERVLRGAHLSFHELTVVLTTRAASDEYPDHYSGPIRVGPRNEGDPLPVPPHDPVATNSEEFGQ